ncbi:VanZ family protein [Pelovirga terrestris]|uniref:VanZ family protein n=1 Tax=Pelovirga terrestris TaxID=2771352 RepID=A0A8J6ULK2_9BACT|nr:VanZ family protein [Pelovirga terrestris]MBD1401297.1 VanZ family protein [Pelovirga terrestris]
MFGLSRCQTFLLLPPALISAVLLFVGGPGPDSLRSVRHAWVSGHLVCFALWGSLYLSWRGNLPIRRLLVEVVLLSFLVGGMTELLQSLVGREPSWRDVFNDVLGGLLAVLFFAPGRHQLVAPLRHVAQFVLLLVVVWSLIPFSRALADDLISRHQFPLLSGFETPFEQTRWGGKSRRYIDEETVYQGRKALQVELVAGWYPGVFLNFFPADWRGYAALQMYVHHPLPEPLELHLRIHDRHHRVADNLHSDRFNAPVVLNQGWNRIRVALAEVAKAPRERELDLRRVAGVGLFAVSLEAPQMIAIDEVRLLGYEELLLSD